MKIEQFIKELKKIGIEVDSEKLEKLEKYYDILIKWNKVINLTRIIDKEDVYLKHFYDSLTITKIINLNEVNSLCDVGTGAGFPGIVLKIVYPNLKITLIDSLNKRVKFLNQIIKELCLKDIIAIHTRMEDYSKNNIEKFDVITSRAVANISVLSEISVKSLKIGGHLILLKGKCKEELDNAINHIKELGCNINKVEDFKLPIEESDRMLIDIIKKSKTSNKYPRSFDKIKKTL